MMSQDRKITQKITQLQSEIDKMKHGYCISFKLLNYDESKVMTEKNINLVDRLDKIIQEVYDEFASSNQYSHQINNNQLAFHQQILPDKIIIILPAIFQKMVREFVLRIYLLSQLYIDDEFPEIYMNCHIASVEFPQISQSAKEINNLLNWLLTSPNNQNYYHEYTPQHYNIESIKESINNLNLLRKALLKKTMVFAYQPVVDRRTMEIHYYECLLRIPNNQNKLLSVGSIIPEAEKRGLIFVVDQIVLEMAIKELAANPNLTLAVNISNIGILDPALLARAKKLLQTYDVFGRLIIEITETSLNQNYKQIAFFMHKLRAFGCKFALDDFGSGFTSYKQLQNLPIDIIKIDGSYVRSIISDIESQKFIENLIKISESLGAQTVAEFVENGEIARFLINLKVDSMQGNFFSPALVDRTEL
jgi:EAL domain-containing protein (putative c-di-GMP-specific phosphodiesterase class I)